MPLRLTERQLSKLLGHREMFEHVERLTGVPWRAMAAVWYRESFSVAVPKTPGGQFQFDPPPPDHQLRWLLHTFTQLEPAEIEQLIKRGICDFEAAALFAACHLRTKVRPVVTPDASDQLIIDALWGYNGRAYGSADHSPYVMSGLDAEHDGMIIRGTIPDQAGGRKRIATVDRRPGAYVVYRQLRDATS